MLIAAALVRREPQFQKCNNLVVSKRIPVRHKFILPIAQLAGALALTENFPRRVGAIAELAER